jgi:hypothetical protein
MFLSTLHENGLELGLSSDYRHIALYGNALVSGNDNDLGPTGKNVTQV